MIERGAAEIEREPKRGIVRQMRRDDAHRDRGIGAELSDAAEVDVTGEADQAGRPRMPEQQRGQTRPWKEHEEDRREDENGHGQRARREQELSADDPTAPQDAWHVDGKARPVASSLPVIAFDLATQMAEHQGARGDDEKSEETEAVGEAPSEHRSGNEVHER